jgi:hypothetical protein
MSGPSPIERAVLAGLAAAGMRTVAKTAAKAPPERPRWKNGDPKRQLPNGNWMTDYRALIEEKFDGERITADEDYARVVYREIGAGDEALGQRRYSEALAADYFDAKAAKIEASKTDVVSQSAFEKPGASDAIFRAERIQQLRGEIDERTQRIAALEIADEPPSE